jgi:hypothetical protein
MNLPAAGAPQAADDEKAAFPATASQLTFPTSDNNELFAATRARHHFCTPNKKRQMTSQPACTLLQ